MNIFFVDENPRVAAKCLGDKHVGKMLIESCQMLSTVLRSHGLEVGYKSAYENHPMTKWVGQSFAHYEWLLQHAIGLAEEFEYRYGKSHASVFLLPNLIIHSGYVPVRGWRNPPRCMPDQYKLDYDDWLKNGDGTPCHVASYRKFYQAEKTSCHKWTRREPPAWMQLSEEVAHE